MKVHKKIPELCPTCGKLLRKDVVRLLEGGFLYKEKCPINSVHYSHYREPTWREVGELND